MTVEERLISNMAKSFVSLGFKPPQYKKPRWHNFKLKKMLAYYDKVGWPYVLEET